MVAYHVLPYELLFSIALSEVTGNGNLHGIHEVEMPTKDQPLIVLHSQENSVLIEYWGAVDWRVNTSRGEAVYLPGA